MNVYTLWLLVAIGTNTTVVERFASQQECERVKAAIVAGWAVGPTLRCVEAKVARQ